MAVPEPYAPFIENIKKLFNGPTYSDLTIICGGDTWSVRKAIVCSRSKWFADALKHPMKEAEENTIELKEIDPDVVGQMLRYVYTYDYFDPIEPEDCATSPSFHVAVHIAADRFGLKDLEKLAASKFKSCVAENWGTRGFADAAVHRCSGSVPRAT